MKSKSINAEEPTPPTVQGRGAPEEKRAHSSSNTWQRLRNQIELTTLGPLTEPFIPFSLVPLSLLQLLLSFICLFIQQIFVEHRF